MNRNTNRDYYEREEEGDEEKVELSGMELVEMIEQRLNMPLEGRPEYWRKDTNNLIDEYTRRFGHGYSRV